MSTKTETTGAGEEGKLKFQQNGHHAHGKTKYV